MIVPCPTCSSQPLDAVAQRGVLINEEARLGALEVELREKWKRAKEEYRRGVEREMGLVLARRKTLRERIGELMGVDAFAERPSLASRNIRASVGKSVGEHDAEPL